MDVVKPEQVEHLIERARKRYELELTSDDIAEICAMICERKQGARLVRDVHSAAQNWVVAFKGQRLRVRWDSVNMEALTFMPRQGKCTEPFKMSAFIGGVKKPK